MQQKRGSVSLKEMLKSSFWRRTERVRRLRKNNAKCGSPSSALNYKYCDGRPLRQIANSKAVRNKAEADSARAHAMVLEISEAVDGNIGNS